MYNNKKFREKKTTASDRNFNKNKIKIEEE